jgi:8-amino-7-oxononanoate synthase
MTRDPAWLTEGLDDLKREHLLRPRRVVEPLGPGHSRVDGQDLVDFSSNDYLGLARDPRLIQAAATAPAGAGASPLVSGRSPQYCRLEESLARFEKTEAVLLFPSGFAANLGTITALMGPDDAVFSDQRNHASLIDGCRLCRARLHIYHHQSLDRLREQLTESADARRRLIITDGLFSMDGTIAPLVQLADLADEFDAMLLVDEAHATGVLGASGRGTCERLEIEQHVTLRIGTLSKAVGAAGGFVAGSRTLIDHLWHHARTQVFSTALPPATCAAAELGLQLIDHEPNRRDHLEQLGSRLRQHLAGLGLDNNSKHGPIVPVILGSAAAAVEASSLLAQHGHFVPAIRPPSVAAGTARLRISLSAAHTDHDIDRLAKALALVSVGEVTAHE